MRETWRERLGNANNVKTDLEVADGRRIWSERVPSTIEVEYDRKGEEDEAVIDLMPFLAM